MTTPTRTTLTANPSLWFLWFLSAVALLAGLIVRSAAVDVEDRFGQAQEQDPALLDLAHTLLGIGGMMLTGSLVASAICFQVSRR